MRGAYSWKRNGRTVVIASIIVLVPIISAQECPLLRANDLSSVASQQASGLVFAALSFSRLGLSGVDDILIVEYNIVCPAQGSTRDTNRMVSVIVRFISNSASASILPFHFECNTSNI